MSRLICIIKNRLPYLVLIPWIAMVACSNPNAEAPTQGNTHLSDYLLDHSVEANDDLERCKVCHRDDLQGVDPETNCLICHEQGPTFAIHAVPFADPYLHGGDAKDNLEKCLSCHGTPPNSFDGGIVADPDLFNIPTASCSASDCHPDAGAHPTNWIESDTATNGYRSTHTSAANRYQNCILCHDYSQGRTGPNRRAPSCFSTEFTNSSGSASGCHPGGGVGAPHDLPYTAAQSHGADARANLAYCQQCHGSPGTTRFNGGTASTSCSTSQCHADAGAHPTRWQGSNDNTSSYRSTHRTAGNRRDSCRLCHDYDQGRSAPNPDAPSCFRSSFTNSDGVTTGCHDD